MITEQGMVPSFATLENLVPSELVPIEPGMFHGVHFTMPAEQLEWFTAKIEVWFADHNEVILVARGITTKQGLGYICLEWEGCEINPLFLAILKNEEMIHDYSVYIRSEEVY